jgi:hypothetical protein
VDPVTETPAPPAGAEAQVTALYQAHAAGLVRLAMLMLGDQSSAEDVVQRRRLGRKIADSCTRHRVFNDPLSSGEPPRA